MDRHIKEKSRQVISGDLMKILRRGAEAILYLDKFGNEQVLVKERIKKGYRISELDDLLRKQRTKTESRLINEASRAGVKTPRIIDTDEKDAKITMEFIDGRRVKDVLNNMSREQTERICELIGESVARLHSADIVHGDLTTSNMILRDNNVYFIDFGLAGFSKRSEDKATDLHLLHQALKSTHFAISEQCWKAILKSYSKNFNGASDVLKRIEEIGKRGRYKER